MFARNAWLLWLLHDIIKICAQSFPILIIIGIYERHFAAGQRLRESSKGAVYSLYNSLPRRIRHIPFLEAMVGPNGSELYNAIFDVGVSHEFQLFEGSDDDFSALHSPGASAGENIRPWLRTPRKRVPSLRSQHMEPPPSPRESSRTRKISSLSPLVETLSSTEVPSSGTINPLAKLFLEVHPQTLPSTSATPLDEHPPATAIPDPAAAAAAVAVKKMETLLEEMRGLPVQRLRDEMKELQVRLGVSPYERGLILLVAGPPGPH